MSYYIGDEDVRKFAEATVGRKLTPEEQARLNAALVKHHDPRSHYRAFTWKEVQEMTGFHSKYSIGNYQGGLGVGCGESGLLGYLDDDAVKQYEESQRAHREWVLNPGLS